MWSCLDNQEVGLEAAILKECVTAHWSSGFCADNVAGLKHTAEVVAMIFWIVG